MFSLFIISCENEEVGKENSSCSTILDQPAQGTFKGVSFSIKGGSHQLLFERYYCQIHVFDKTGGDCIFPIFGGNEGKILFGLSNLEPQTIVLSDVVGEGETLNFNSIEMGKTVVELAKCGTLEIISSTSTTVSGRLIAEGQKGSTVNGNFTLTLCTE